MSWTAKQIIVFLSKYPPDTVVDITYMEDDTIRDIHSINEMYESGTEKLTLTIISKEKNER
jgi:hypothetical protein